jgi:hypothetical protein
VIQLALGGTRNSFVLKTVFQVPFRWNLLYTGSIRNGIQQETWILAHVAHNSLPFILPGDNQGSDLNIIRILVLLPLKYNIIDLFDVDQTLLKICPALEDLETV